MLLFSPEYLFPKSVSIALIVVLLANLTLFAAIFHIEQANAQFTDVAAVAQRVAKFIWDAAKWVYEKAVDAKNAAYQYWVTFKSSHGIIAEIISSLLLVMMHQVLAKLTNDIVAWINGGGKGQIRVLQDPGEFLLSALDEAGGALAGAILNVDPATLCDASYLKFKLKAAFTGPYAVPTFDEKVACTFTGMGQGLQKFKEDFGNGGWASFIELSRKENNQIGQALIVNEEIENLKSNLINTKGAMVSMSNGFLAQEKCTVTQLPADSDAAISVLGINNAVLDSTMGMDLEYVYKTISTGGFASSAELKKFWIAAGGQVECKVTTPAQQISELANKALQAPMKRLEDSITGLTSKLGTGAGSVIKPYVLAIAGAGLNLLLNKGIGLITNQLQNAKRPRKGQRQPTSSLQENTMLAQSSGALAGSVNDFRSFLLKALVEFSIFTTSAVTALTSMGVLGRMTINRAETELRGGTWYLGGPGCSDPPASSCGACPLVYEYDATGTSTGYAQVLNKITGSPYSCDGGTSTSSAGYSADAITTNAPGKVFFEEAQWCGAYHQELAFSEKNPQTIPTDPLPGYDPYSLILFTTATTPTCPTLTYGTTSVLGDCTATPSWVQYDINTANGPGNVEMATRLVGYSDTANDETAGDGISRPDRFIRQSIVGADTNDDGVPDAAITSSPGPANITFSETLVYTTRDINSNSSPDTVITNTAAGLKELFEMRPEYTREIVNETGIVTGNLLVGLAQAAVAGGYIFGGYNQFGHSNKVRNLSTGAVVAAMPDALSGSVAVSGPNGMIYLFGGFNSSGSHDTILKFDPSNSSLTKTSASLPEKAAGISAAYYPSTERIYLFGGTTKNGPQTWVLEYNPSMDTLTTKNAVLPIPLAHAAAAVAAKSPPNGERRIFVFGGFTSRGFSSPRIFEYDPSTSAIISKSTVIESRGFLTATRTSPNTITLIGGQSEYGLLAKVDAYNAQTDSVSSSLLPSPRSRGAGNASSPALFAGGVVPADPITNIKNAKIFPQGDIYHIPAAIHNNQLTTSFWEKYYSPTFDGGSALLFNTRDGFSYHDFTGTLRNTFIRSQTNTDANLVWLTPPFYPELLEKVQELMERSRVIEGYNYSSPGVKNYQSGLADQLGATPDDNPYDNNPSNPSYTDKHDASGNLISEGYKGSVTDVLTAYNSLTQTYQTLFGGLTDESALEGVDKDMKILSPTETNIKLALIGGRCPALPPSATSTPDLIAKCPQFAGTEYNMARRFIFEPDYVSASPLTGITGITTGFATNPFTGQKSSALAGILNLDEMTTQLQSLSPDKNIIKLIRLRQILEQLQVDPQDIPFPGKAGVFIDPAPLSGVDLIQLSLPGYEHIQAYLNDTTTRNLSIQTLIEAYGYTNAKEAYPEISKQLDDIFDSIIIQITDDLKETFLKRVEKQLEESRIIAQHRLRRFLEYVKDLNAVVKLEMPAQRGAQLPSGQGADVARISETSSVLRIDAKQMFLNNGQGLNALLSRTASQHLTDLERNGIIGSAIYKIKSFAKFMGADASSAEFSARISQYYTPSGSTPAEREADLDQRVKNALKDVYMYYAGIYDQTDETLSAAERAIASAYCGFSSVKRYYYCNLTAGTELLKDARTKLEELQNDFSLMMEELSKVTGEFRALFSSITMEKQSIEDLMKLLTALSADYNQANACVGLPTDAQNLWIPSSAQMASLQSSLNSATGKSSFDVYFDSITDGAKKGFEIGNMIIPVVGGLIGSTLGSIAGAFGGLFGGGGNDDAYKAALLAQQKVINTCKEGITNYNKHLGQLADQFLCGKTNPKYEDQ